MTIQTSNMIKWLIHIDHLEKVCPCSNYLSTDHIPNSEKKYKIIVKKLLALLNRLQWAENEQCANQLIYMWAEQYVVYD